MWGLLPNFAELIAELCTVRFGTVRPYIDPYSSAERRTWKIKVRPITNEYGMHNYFPQISTLRDLVT